MQPRVVSEQAANREELPFRPPFRWLRYTVIAGVCLLLAWPVVYLVVRRAAGYPGQAVGHPKPLSPSITDLEAALSAHSSETNLIHLSALDLNTHQPGRAIPLLRSILAKDKNNADAWNNLCDAYNQTMRYNLAVDACTHALHIKPSYQLARNNLGFALSEIQKTQSMISAQEHVAPSVRNATFYVAEGMNLLHIGRYREAIQAWQHALARDPRNAAAANDIGIAYMFLHQPADAIPWFQKAISFAPHMQLAKNNLAWGQEELSKAAVTSP